MCKLYLAVAVVSLACLYGCHKVEKSSTQSSGDVKYVANWSSLKVGMSKRQVRRILGTPAYITRYNEDTAHVPRAREFGDNKAALKADMEAIFGEPHMWQYGRVGIMDPSEQAFLVYFDATGHVTRWRQPLGGPQSHGIGPAESPARDDDAVRKKTPEDLWNTPNLQRK